MRLHRNHYLAPLKGAAALSNVQSLLLKSASSQRVDLGNSFRFTQTQPFSVFAWVYVPSTALNTTVISNAGTTSGWALQIRAGGNIRFVFVGPAAGLALISSVAVGTGAWHLVGVTYDGTNAASGIKLWLDGVQDASPTVNSNAPLSSTSYDHITQIGIGTEYTNYFDGYIGDTSIWGTALGSTAITSLYNSGGLKDLTGSANLLSWYRMGNGKGDSGATLKDQAGTADGTIQNGGTYVTFAPFSMTQSFYTQVKNSPNIAFLRGNYADLPYYTTGQFSSPYDAPDLQTWNISNPTSPSLVSTIATTYPTNTAASYPAISGNKGLLPFWKSSNVEVLDYSTPSAPAYSSSFSTTLTNSIQAVFINSNIAYIIGNNGTGTAGSAAIVDMTTSPPTVLGYFTIPLDVAGYGLRAVLKGTNLFITGADDHNLKVFDVSTPTSPSLIATLALGTAPMTLTLDGNYLYITVTGGLYVIDISTPSAPSNVKTVSFTGTNLRTAAVSTKRKLLFVPVLDQGTIEAISIYDPPNAFAVKSYSLGNDGNGYQQAPGAATILGDNLYITTGTTPPALPTGESLGYLEVVTLA